MTRQLTYREYTKEFITFLKEHNAYNQFIKEFKKAYRIKKHYYYRQQGLSDYEMYAHINPLCLPNVIENNNVIDTLLLWKDTEQGQFFWSDLHFRWRKRMKDTEIVREKTRNK